MKRPREQQFGITNHLEIRLQTHRRKGWEKQDHVGPFTGDSVFLVEREIKKWLRNDIGLIPGTYENWYTKKLNVKKLEELFQKASSFPGQIIELFKECID